MARIRPRTLLIVIFMAPLATLQPFAQDSKQAEREEMYRRYLDFPKYVRGGEVEPHWMAGGNSFWYAEGAPENTVIWKVDPVANTKEPMFDVGRLRGSIAEALGHELREPGVPFKTFDFVDGEQVVQFSIGERRYLLDLDSYDLTRLSETSELETAVPRSSPERFGWPDRTEILSPDGKWLAGIEDYNVYIRSTEVSSRRPLTTDGTEEIEWGDVPWRSYLSWSPDSRLIAVKRLDQREVPKVPIIHYLEPQEKVDWIHYRRAGQPGPRVGIHIIDVASGRNIPVDIEIGPYQGAFILDWVPDASELLFARVDRYYRNIELFGADGRSGSTRILLQELGKPGVGGGRQFSRALTFLSDGKEFIWLAERKMIGHLLRYDIQGKHLSVITNTPYRDLKVLAVDEADRWIYFLAGEVDDHPANLYLYRAKLNGDKLTKLIDRGGIRQIHFSPSTRFFVENYSSTSQPPVSYLRHSDGAPLQTLEVAHTEGLRDLRWPEPEEFIFKADDGETNLYGILYKPYDLDPERSYPVVVFVYGAFSVVHPHQRIPRAFKSNWIGVWAQALAQTGFITLVVDNRREEGEVGRVEVPDFVAALRQTAASRSYMDLSRVGIRGGSYGGYMALRAMLQAPEVFRVGIAGAPMVSYYNHHWGEWSLGPIDENKEQYEYASNLHLAQVLEGQLLLIHGTADTANLFSETMKMTDALIRANKPLDLLIVPEGGHNFSDPSMAYIHDAVRRYFQEHLQP